MCGFVSKIGIKWFDLPEVWKGNGLRNDHKRSFFNTVLKIIAGFWLLLDTSYFYIRCCLWYEQLSVPPVALFCTRMFQNIYFILYIKKSRYGVPYIRTGRCFVIVCLFSFSCFSKFTFFMYMCSVAYFKGCSFTGVRMEFKINFFEREWLKF